MGRETWKFPKGTELRRMSCLPEDLGKFYCLRKDRFSTKEVFTYSTLAWGFYDANKLIPYRGYSHSSLYSHFPLLGCPQNIATTSGFVSLKSLTGDQTQFMRDKTKVTGGCGYFILKRDRKNNPLMYCVWVKHEAVQLFYLGDLSFSVGQ